MRARMRIERLGLELSLGTGLELGCSRSALSSRVFAKRVKLKIRKSNCNCSYSIVWPASCCEKEEGGRKDTMAAVIVCVSQKQNCNVIGNQNSFWAKIMQLAKSLQSRRGAQQTIFD